MTTPLALQQQQLAAAIAGPGSDVTSLLRNTPQGSKPRIDIYRHAYRARLTAALKENFPVLHRVLGDDDFQALADEFLGAHPAHEPSIRWFGAELPAFLAQRADLAPHPCLSDLAHMEWALGTAFDAADAPCLAVADLLALPPDDWPGLAFTPHPSVRLLQLIWAVEPLWSLLSADEHAAAPPPEPFAHHLLVWRGQTQTQWRSVTGVEEQLLAACLSGQAFAALCELAAAEVDAQAAATAAGFLRVWVEAGIFSACRRAA